MRIVLSYEPVAKLLDFNNDPGLYYNNNRKDKDNNADFKIIPPLDACGMGGHKKRTMALQ